MEHKKIIDKPTYKTNPDTIVHGNLKEIIPVTSNLAPRDFDTARRVHAIRNKYLDKDDSTFKGKLANIITDPDPERRVAVDLTVAAAAGLSMLFILFGGSFVVDELFHFDNDPASNIVGRILVTILALALPIAGTVKAGTYHDTPYFVLSRAEKKAFKNAEFVAIDSPVKYRVLDPQISIRASKLTALFDNDEDTSDTVDFSHLRHAYDNYMDLYVFCQANADAMSHNVFAEYQDELLRRGALLEQEIKNVNTLIEDNAESYAELTRGQRDMEQEMLDDDIRRAMPLAAPEELES